MPVVDYIERFVSWIFLNNRGNDDLMFTKSPAFANFPNPTITVTSPDGGESNCVLKLEHTQDGEDRHPILEWKLPEGLTADVAAQGEGGKTRIYEYLVTCEDADLPIPRRFAKVRKSMQYLDKCSLAVYSPRKDYLMLYLVEPGYQLCPHEREECGEDEKTGRKIDEV